MPDNVFNSLPVNDAQMIPPGSTGSAIKDFFKNMLTDPNGFALTPMGLGVVAGSPGADAMVDSLMGSKPKNALDAVLNYAKLKYPRLMNKVAPIALDLNRDQLGAWTPYDKWIGKIVNLGGGEQTGPMVINKLPSNALNTIKTNKGLLVDPLEYALEKIDTVGHELTHGAIQATRTPQMLENYIKPEADFMGYMNQPAEVNANRGGATASKTFLNFLAQYPEMKKLFGIGQ